MPKQQKDPNKPKGAKSAYIFFVEAQKKLQPGTVEFTKFSKECGAKWAELDAVDKRTHEEKAALDKQRYNREMQDYIPPEDYDEDGIPQPKKKKKKKDPNAPKKNLSSYFIFSGDERASVCEELGTNKCTQVMGVVAERWKVLREKAARGEPEAVQRVEGYQQRAQADQERYLKEKAQFERGQFVPAGGYVHTNDNDGGY
jgi:hypothetical protein